MPRLCFTDTETFSEADIRRTGAAKYFEHESTRTDIVTFNLDGPGTTQCWDRTASQKIPYELEDAVLDDDVIFIAFNVPFDIQAYRKAGMDVPIERWRCLQVAALALSINGSLDQVLARLGVPYQKQRDGQKLLHKFCKPQPTNRKVKIWNSKNAPEDWERYKQYGTTDTDILLPLFDKIQSYGVKVDWGEWLTDQRINERGLPIDMTLVHAALRAADQEKERLLGRMFALTKLENPNSKPQQKVWLRDHGLNLPNMQKGTLEIALTNKNNTPEVTAVLKLAQHLSKTSTAKWEALDRTVLNSGRLRYTHQYLGAARTGRDAHRLFQPGNLPRGNIKNAAAAADMLIGHGRESLELVYGSVMDPLSSLLRAAITAPDGCVLTSADLAGIEGRVLPWQCDFVEKLDLIEGGMDMYTVAAAGIFPSSYDDITESERFIGKIIELACVAKGQMVLTHVGLVPIERITQHHFLWDGEDFVGHGGLKHNGTKEVITYDGLTATPDHIVFTEQGELQLIDAARSGSRIIQSGSGRKGVWVGKVAKPRKKVHTGVGRRLRARWLHWLWAEELDELSKLSKREVSGVPEVFEPEKDTVLAGQAFNCGETAVRKPLRRRLQELWRERSRVPVPFGYRSWADYYERAWSAEGKGARPYRQQQALRERESEVVGQVPADAEREKLGASAGLGVLSSGVAIRKVDCGKETKIRSGQGPDPKRGGRGCYSEAEKLAWNPRQAAVYDILNCGPNNRFTVEGRLVHNCGYQGYTGAFMQMAASYNVKFTDEGEIRKFINKWRVKNAAIVTYWAECQDGVRLAIRNPGKGVPVHRIEFVVLKDFLYAILPSGRRLAYHKPQYADNQFTYMGPNTYTRKWERLESYGGKIVENCIAEGSLVFTDVGWVPIEDINLSHRIYDGVEFVEHGGRVFKSMQNCINIDGVYMTPDHRVLTHDGWKTAGQTARPDGPKVRYVGGGIPYNSRWAQIKLDVSMRLRKFMRKSWGRYYKRSKAGRDPELRVLNEKANREREYYTWYEQSPGILCLEKYDGPVQTTLASGMEKLRRERDRRVSPLEEVHQLLGGYGPFLQERSYSREDGQRFRVLESELRVEELLSPSKQQERVCESADPKRSDGSGRGCEDVRTEVLNSSVQGGSQVAARDAVCETKSKQSRRVFDILNCGPRSRFVVKGEQGMFTVHNCTQAIARDVFFHGLKLYEDGGGKAVLRVHDEIVSISSEEEAEQDLAFMVQCMTAVPVWAKGLPLAAKGYNSKRYKK